MEVTLRKPRSSDELRATLIRVGESSRRLAELVEGLLLLARVDTGLAEDVREDRVLGDLVRAAVSREASSLAAAGVEVVVGPDVEAVVRVHPTLVVAAVATLLRNVARYAPAAPVEVGTEVGDGVASVSVDDGGGGIPAADRAVGRAHGGDCVIEIGRRGGCRVRLALPVGRPRGAR